MKVFRVIHDYINEHFKRNTPAIDDVMDVSDAVDMYTYNDYESSNPMRIDFWQNQIDQIENKMLRQTAGAAQNIGAEVMSAYTNPYYIPHKIINIPKDYKNVVETYKKYSDVQEKKTGN